MSQARSIPDHDAVVAMFEEQARREDAVASFIADKIEANPSLLAKPLANIARWCSQGIWAQDKLAIWREKIIAAQQSPEAMTRLLELLRDGSEEARHLRSFSPFSGMLTKEEKARFA
jgi:hypothetical protein